MKTDEEKITEPAPAGHPQPQDVETRPAGMPPLPESEPEEYDFEEEEEDRSVYGWLFLFLWVGIGLGTVGSIFSLFANIGDIRAVGANGLELACYCYSLMAAALGVYTIVGFYRGRPDAVACGMFYTLLMICDGIATIILNSRLKIPGGAADGLRPIIWGIVWLAFLFISARVRAVIPPERRKMTWLAGILMAGCAGAMIFLQVQMYGFIDSHPIEQGMDEEMPVQLDEYAVVTEEPLDGEAIDEAEVSCREDSTGVTDMSTCPANTSAPSPSPLRSWKN